MENILDGTLIRPHILETLKHTLHRPIASYDIVENWVKILDFLVQTTKRAGWCLGYTV